MPIPATVDLAASKMPLTGECLTCAIEEAANILGVSRRTVYVLIDNGELPAIKIARRRLILREDLATFLASARGRAQVVAA